MADESKVPTRRIATVAASMLRGRVYAFAVDAVAVDPDGSAWLEPFARPLGEGKGTGPIRWEGGRTPEAHVLVFAQGGRFIFNLEESRTGVKRWTPRPRATFASPPDWIRADELIL